MTRLQFMSTFFYKKITSVPQRSRGDTISTDELFESIAKRWLIARGVDLFTKKMVFVPVHHEFHWSVAVLCNLDAFLHGWSTGSDPESKQRPCILYLDSVRPASPGGMTKALRSFLAVYARARQTALFSPGHCRPSRRGAASSSTMHLAAVLNPPQPESTESAFMPLAQECRQDEMEDSTVATDVIDVICGDSNSTPLMTRKHAFHAELDETSDVLPQTTGLVFDGDSLPLLKPKVPLQENSMDCGIYTLMYVEYLATKWPESYQLDRLNQRTSELFGTSDVDAYRMEIERVVRCLAHSQGIENLPESVCYDIDAADMEDA
ncbi:hypothetical protein F1559_002065 [Cyanidiococcus yangmingshanensis]|uniref:Ubiquitin-like protease family profile domain-containing protein n=1 Tax=Cyanidiococcus yangmingshanensis TaxID=2690220 RepID=A0A7J7ID73_9RHOD|nr:hypothetical protein F1559_002065 [Cyanidiococcus yangmingshanensis]